LHTSPATVVHQSAHHAWPEDGPRFFVFSLAAIVSLCCHARAVMAMEGVSTSAVCEYTTECDGVGLQCIDRRCMCNPLWAHTGPNCDELRWASWGLV
ncbi:unnamed protein product, partial [Ectocarpus sp. 12 AP-2014]